MRNSALASALLVTVMASPAMANQDVIKNTADPKQWTLQTGDYTNNRYS